MDQHEASARYAELLAQFTRVLQESDPLGIAEMPGEYEAEAAAILARMRTASSVSDVQFIAHEVFREAFDSDLAGPFGDYHVVAERLWAIWRGTE